MPNEIPARKSRQYASPRVPASAPTQMPQAVPEIAEDDRYYLPAQMIRSARRYVNTDGDEVMEQGNRRLVIHRQSPRRQGHWMLLVLIGMIAMGLLALLENWAVASWQTHQVDAQYGYPRTWQTDEVVGHNDSAAHPTHFLFLNLQGKVFIVELPGGDPAHARIYTGPTIFGPGGDKVPVTGTFTDVNGDGKLDMEVHIQDQTIIYLNDGTQFKPQQP